MKADRLTNIEVATQAWGDPSPDWISELARLCDRQGQRHAGISIGYSTATISQVLRKKYPGDMEKFEQAVRGALLRETVTCPVMGEIQKDRCLELQRRPIDRMRNGTLFIRTYHACRNGCPNFLGDCSSRKKQKPST